MTPPGRTPDAPAPADAASPRPAHLALYGGSFDPVHLGHVLVARAALEELALDRLLVIPAALSPFKPGSRPTPGDLRLRMLRLAFAGMTRVEIDDQELRRGGTSYSIDTARACAARFPGARLFWLIGEDHLGALPAWRDARDLAQLLEFVVIPRPGAPASPPPAGFRIHPLRGFPIEVSSSALRDRAAAGLPLAPLVPEAVAAVIEQEQLYRRAV